MENKKLIWNDASVPGLVLGAISVAYLFANMAIGRMPVGALQGLASGAAWLAKFLGCIYLFKFFMQRFASDRDEVTNSDSFLFGVAMALYSAFLVAAIQYLYCAVINPDYLSNAVETALKSFGSQLDSNSINALNDMLPQLPMIGFISTLIWCFLFGTVLSAIFSRKIPSTNPFEN